MTSEAMDTTTDTDATQMATPRATRMSRKRTVFASCPRPAIAVRALWEQASEAEKHKAHQCCMAILDYWLGKATKAQIAERLEVLPLRVWQLSQQALSGMLAGLLRQPKSRAKVTLAPASPEDDPKLLRKQIGKLEVKLARTEDLVRVLKDLPWARGVEPKRENHARGKRSRPKARRGAQASPGASAPSRKKARGGDDAGGATGDSGGAGSAAEVEAHLEA